MARAHFVKKARKANTDAGINKGDSYWWWKFRRGGKHFSKTKPKQSQLTQSEFLGEYYSIQEDLQIAIDAATSQEDFEMAGCLRERKRRC